MTERLTGAPQAERRPGADGPAAERHPQQPAPPEQPEQPEQPQPPEQPEQPEQPAHAGDASPTGSRDGRSTRWDPHRRERRLAIINAAIAAIEEHGLDTLTSQVAERAGVPRTHVYRHFDGKQALDLAVSRHVAAQIGEHIRAGLATRGSAFDVIRGAVGQHLAWVEAHPNLYRFLAAHAYTVNVTGTPTVDDAKAAFANELSALLAGYLRAFHVDTAPAERVIVGVVGMVDSTAAWWLDHREPGRDQLTGELTEQVWLILDRSARELGLQIDPTAPLPALD